MQLGPHAAFIVAAYAATALVLAGLVIWVLLDYRMLRNALAELDSKGVTRRAFGHPRGVL